MRTTSRIVLAVMFTGISCSVMGPRPMPPEYRPQPTTRTAYHTVSPGETLWRIAKMYNVPVAVIVNANHLPDPEHLKMGQVLKIPNASRPQPVITLYPSDKWKAIVIHHSATEEGSALTFHQAHLRRGWENGVGYHFVIDRRASGKQDGQIETTPRWLKQMDGAHCKASDMNTKAIGICLVGNFDKERPTRRQMESLVTLVKTLQRAYHIPDSQVFGHGQVPGAETDCPGKRFPWDKFRRELRRP